MSVATYASEQIVKAMFTADTLTRPTNWYLSLHTADPGRDGSNEVADSNYARQSATFTASLDVDLWQAVNDAEAAFPAANAEFTVTHVGVFDSLSAGSPIVFVEIPIARTVQAGGVFTVPAGELVINGGVA